MVTALEITGSSVGVGPMPRWIVPLTAPRSITSAPLPAAQPPDGASLLAATIASRSPQPLVAGSAAVVTWIVAANDGSANAQDNTTPKSLRIVPLPPGPDSKGRR